jgi:GLPGLI family protein
MKKLLLMAGALFLLEAAWAQIHSGRVVFERKINLHRGVQDEQTRAMVPEFKTDRFHLFFSDSVSVYKPAPQDEMPDPFSNNNSGLIIRMGPSDNAILYKNFATQRIITQVELEEKKYLVLDTLVQDPWKLEEVTKTMLGHVCKKATRKNKMGKNVVAWYATDISVSAGPDRFGSLPGLILQLDVNEGEVVFTAQEFSSRPENKELKAPTDGKPITAAEFQQKSDALFGPPGSERRMIHQAGN